MSDYNKVKSLLDKVYKEVDRSKAFSSEEFTENYVDTLLEAQAKGEIVDLKFEATEEGLAASFSFPKPLNPIKIEYSQVRSNVRWSDICA